MICFNTSNRVKPGLNPHAMMAALSGNEGIVFVGRGLRQSLLDVILVRSVFFSGLRYQRETKMNCFYQLNMPLILYSPN